MDPAEPAPSGPELGPVARDRSERRAQLREWAYEAERASGRKESEEEDVRRNVWIRLGVIIAGTLVTLGGIALMPLPGPGIVVVLAGLGLLAREVSWAERLLAFAKRKAKVDKISQQAPWLKPVALVMTVIGTAASFLYAFRWR